MEIDLALNNEVEDFKEDYESIYLEIIKEACKQLDIHDDLELSVIFVDDQRIHEINKEYRKIDRSTDVISFALEDSEQYYIEGMPREIGDIFISIDHAKMQAEEYGHSFYREMCFLFTHGLLHLLGFDHMNEEDEKEIMKMIKEYHSNVNDSLTSIKKMLIELNSKNVEVDTKEIVDAYERETVLLQSIFKDIVDKLDSIENETNSNKTDTDNINNSHNNQYKNYMINMFKFIKNNPKKSIIFLAVILIIFILGGVLI